MEWLHKIPSLRPLLFWIAGTLAALYGMSGVPVHVPWMIAGIALIMFVLVRVCFPVASRIPAITGILGAIFFLAGAAGWTLFQNEQRHPSHFSNQTDSSAFMLVRTDAPAQEGENSIHLASKVMAVHKEGGWKDAHGNLLIYLEKSPEAAALDYGEVIAVRGRYRQLKPPGDPYAFDYSQYQFYRRTYHSMYAPGENWASTGYNNGNGLWSRIYKLREQLLAWQETAITDDNRRIVANALLTGYRQDMRDELRDAYAATGAMHILAVSGLHTGMIFLVMNLLLKPLNRIPNGNIVQVGLLIAGLWLYACLTGLAPSVCRAATMFSFVAVGMHTRRMTNVFQSIVLSAFLLLLINPYYIMYAGFQLSYAAVIGIVLLVPRMPEWPGPKYLILEKAWMLSCVSVAAQLFTMPLSLMYFGIFPVWFILTNLVALPLASIVLYSGMGYFALMAVFPASAGPWAGEVLNGALKGLNYWVFMVDGLPASPIEGLWIEPYHALGFFCGIALLFMAIHLRHAKTFIASLTTFMICLPAATFNIYNLQTTPGMFVHDGRGEALIQFTDRQGTVLLDMSSDTNKLERIPPSVKTVMQRTGTPDHRFRLIDYHQGTAFRNRTLFIDPPFGIFYHTRFVVVNGNDPLPEGENDPEVDVIILTNNAQMNLSQLTKRFNPQTIIFDNSNPPWQRAKWKEQCDQIQSQCYDIVEHGAKIIAPDSHEGRKGAKIFTTKTQ